MVQGWLSDISNIDSFIFDPSGFHIESGLTGQLWGGRRILGDLCRQQYPRTKGEPSSLVRLSSKARRCSCWDLSTNLSSHLRPQDQRWRGCNWILERISTLLPRSPPPQHGWPHNRRIKSGILSERKRVAVGLAVSYGHCGVEGFGTWNVQGIFAWLMCQTGGRGRIPGQRPRSSLSAAAT